MKKWFTVAVLALVTVSCGRDRGGESITKIEHRHCDDNCAFKDLWLVHSFPKVIDIGKGKVFPADVMGAADILVADSTIFVAADSRKNFIQAFDKGSCRKMGSFLTQGRGPGEIEMLPFLSGLQIIERDGHLVPEINTDNNYLIAVDFTASAQEDRTVIVDSTALPKGFVTDAIIINDSSIYYKTISDDNTRIIRHFSKGKADGTIPAFDELSSAAIKTKGDGFLFNIISTSARYNVSKKRMVEASVCLNTIHFYDIEGDFMRTVCVGDKLASISNMEQKGAQGVKSTFMSIRIYPDFVAVLYKDPKHNLVQDDGPRSILLFEWDGNPIAEIPLSPQVSSFDFDIRNGMLYTLDEEERIVRYDVSQYDKLLVGK